MLEGKQVLVTGANGALGRVVAEQAAACGAFVIAVDLRFDATTSLMQQISVDLTDAEATAAAFADFETVDAVCNIAGGFSMGPAVHELKNDEWDHLFAMNVTTMRNVVAAIAPKMIARGYGKIVNVGALSAREGQAQMGSYCAAKSVVMRLTESLSKELRHHGVNVNAVLPSIIDTPTNRADLPDADFNQWVAPVELASVMLFLASDASDAIHGALVPVSGLS